MNEYILPDDYKVWGDYLYVADGKVVRSNWHGITIREFKCYLKANVVTSCDIIGRGLLNPKEDTKDNDSPLKMSNSKPKSTKPKKSHKIKKWIDNKDELVTMNEISDAIRNFGETTKRKKL